MSAPHRSYAPWRLMLAVVLAAGSVCALAQNTVARIDFSIGGVTASGKLGTDRPLGKGALLFEGDTVNTDATGRVQIRFTDGAYVSLQPQTQFRVDSYHYGGVLDDTEKGIFSLIKGSLRTITGAIGHRKRDAYQVHTMVATIGIRGTEYLASVVNSLEVSVGEGSLFLLNDAGKFIVEQGQSVYIANQSSAPVILSSPPSLPPAPAQRGSAPPSDTPVFVSGNQLNPFGPTTDLGGGFGNVLPNGSGYAMAVSHGFGNNTDIGIDCAANPVGSCGQPIVTLSGFGVSWTQGSGSPDFHAGSQSGSNGTATFSGGSAGGVIGWGSFINGTFRTGNNGLRTIGANEGIHFVMGIPTSPMPTTGSATLNLIGATRPTFSDNVGGGLGIGTVTAGQLTANFAANTVSTNFNVSFSSGNTYAASGSGVIQGAGMMGALGSFTRTSGASAICTSICSGVFMGIFAGPGASHAGYTYMVTGMMPFVINGAIVFH